MSSSKPDAVSNSGPIIHLSEVDAMRAFDVFKKALIPPEVSNETKNCSFSNAKIILARLNANAKDLANVIVAKYGLGLGEAEAIALAVQEGVDIFLTDDLEARSVADVYDLEPHGTLGILLRAFRERKLSKAAAIGKVRLLYERSSLFVTKDLVLWIIKQIEEYEKRGKSQFSQFPKHLK